MAVRQILCPQVQALRSSLGLRIITQKVGDLDLIGDSSTGTFRPLVPRDLRRQVFEHLHGAAHPGRRATRRLISSRYVWKGLSTNVTAWAKACLGCQRAKVHRHVQVPPQHIPVPSRRFSHIHVDLVGPLPASKGFTYLFTYRRSSRCTMAPTPSFAAPCTTSRCASATRRTRCLPSDSNPARILQRRPRYPGSGAAVCFRDFLSPGAAAARRVHFAQQQPAEPCREPFSPGTQPGVFACPAAVLDNTNARPARNRLAPSRLDL
jgi:hypothetical protein